MDIERKINLSEGVPLNSECTANIVLNTGNSNPKINSSSNGTVIHLKSDKSSASEVGLHINTTFSIASTKKVKLLFVLNFLLSFTCMVISSSAAFYYWSELAEMRRQVEIVKDQLMARSLEGAAGHASPLVLPRPRVDERSPRRVDVARPSEHSASTGKKYYVDGLDEDLHFYKSKHGEGDFADNTPILQRRDLSVAHFIGGGLENNLRTDPIIGPWALDYNASTKDASDFVELRESKYLTINEDGLYLFYAQVVYMTNAPNTFYVWAQKRPEVPRMLSTCSSADVASHRPLRQAQISCAVQTVVRLAKGDVINFAQREKNSTVLLKSGSSYFGFVKLTS